jgi:anti-anti-sigma factor
VSTLDASSLHVDVRATEEGVVIELRGDLDISTAGDLWRRIDELGGTAEVTVLDLSGLDFVDSSGISCLFRLHQRVADAGGMVVARGPSARIRRLFDMTQLNRLIAVLD